MVLLMVDSEAGQATPRRIMAWLRRHWLRLLAHLAAMVPLVGLVRALLVGSFLFDPIKEATIRTGRLAALFLLLTLTCTPLATISGWRRLRRARRPLGLWSLVFATMHMLVFVVWDYGLDLQLLRTGILAQSFVLVGMGSFLILLLLGVTSWPSLQRRMGRSWRWVQRGIYAAAVLDVWHIVWVKKSPWEARQFIVALGVLLVLRLPPVSKGIARLRGSANARGAS